MSGGGRSKSRPRADGGMKVCSFTASTLSWLQSRIGVRALVTFFLEGGGGYLGQLRGQDVLMVCVRELLFYLTQQQEEEECYFVHYQQLL